MSRSQILILAALALVTTLVCLIAVGILLVRLTPKIQVTSEPLVIQTVTPSATPTEMPEPAMPTSTNTLVIQSTPTRPATITPVAQINTPVPIPTKQKCRIRMGSTYILVDCDQLD